MTARATGKDAPPDIGRNTGGWPGVGDGTSSGVGEVGVGSPLLGVDVGSMGCDVGGGSLVGKGVLVGCIGTEVTVGSGVAVGTDFAEHAPRVSPCPRCPGTALGGTHIVCSAAVPGL